MRFFAVIILSGIHCLFCFQLAESAEMKIVDNSVFVETDTYEVEFTDGVITHLYNKLTEEIYTLPLGVGGVTGFRGRSGLLKRDGRSLWTDQATLTQAKKVAPLKAEIVFRQGRNEFRLFIGVDARSGDLLLEQEGTSDIAGVYGIQWGCVNLNVRMDVSHEIDLLSELHLVKTGIVHKGKELPQQRGATFQKMVVSIAGIQKPAIDAHPPYESIPGDHIRRDSSTFGEWTLSLPDTSTPLYLDFDIGLREGSQRSDGVTFIVSIGGTEVFRRLHKRQKWEHIRLDLTPYRNQRVTLRFSTAPGPVGDPAWDWAMWGDPEITYEPVAQLTEIGFFIPNEPIRSFPDTLENRGNGQYWLKAQLPAQVLILFGTPQQTEMLDNLRDAHFVAGLQFDSIFWEGSVWGSGKPWELTATGVRKQTLNGHPPPGGQTVLQFLLALPAAEDVTFSFSMGLPDEKCSIDGVVFKVLLNGQNRFERLGFNEPGWVDMRIPLTEFAGETVLLELVTDSGETVSCDWAHWADLFITAKGVESSGDVNQDGIVNILDIILVAQNLGQKPSSNPRVDVNKDGQVNILDLVRVAEDLGEKVAAAPSQMEVSKASPSSFEDVIVVRRALNELEAGPEKSQSVQMAIRLLRLYLEDANRSVSETRLLPNYPNPFNPETWIPYQLADAADVSMRIYDLCRVQARRILSHARTSILLGWTQ